MKLTDFSSGLLVVKKLERPSVAGAAPKRHEKSAQPAFEQLLHAHTVRPADEKKPRQASSTDEALLVSRALLPPSRAALLIVTKPVELKPLTLAASVNSKVPVLNQLASRSKEAHAAQRVTGPTEKKRTADEPKRSDAPPEPIALLTTPPAIAVAEPFRIEAPPAIKDAAPLAPLAPVMNEDPSLRVVLLPTIARMSMDTGEAGRINVELKVQNGVTELRATGPAAQILEARQGELRVALAKEGLALGHFDLTQSNQHQRGHAERRDLEVSAPPLARRTARSTDLATEDGRVHVKA